MSADGAATGREGGGARQTPGAQARTARQAAQDARTDRAAGVWAVLAENEFPDLAPMWARWAAIAAGFVAVETGWGPRIRPALALFENSRLGGSTLYRLPDGSAVLSGGMGMAPPDGTDLFAGAPAWIADPVLNPRAGTGRLSFCYWWQAGHWYRGGSPSAERCSQALPGVWTSDAAADILAGLAAQPPNSEASEPTASQREAATRLVTAAESGAVAPAVLTDLFPADRFDSDGALYQLAVAGLAAAAAEPMPEAEAISRVRQFVTGRDLDTTDYPLDQLVADRFSVGWMVYVPVPRGTIAIGRAVFYVGDDGVLEAASSSTAPTAYVADFEARYRRRNRLP